MTGAVIFFHVVVCAFLVTIILMQSGRGGGLTEGFAGAESMFGAKTNVFLIKATAILASCFLVTCLSLAFLSAKKGQSLMSDVAQEAQTQAEATQTSEIPEPIQKIEIPIPATPETQPVAPTE